MSVDMTSDLNRMLDDLTKTAKLRHEQYLKVREQREKQSSRNVDPMSPYEIPHTPPEYKDLTEVMNNRGFAAIYPQTYTPIPDYYRKFNIPPYFNPGEGDDWARGSLTIAGMIELTTNQQPWMIRRIEDLDVIYQITTEYLERISPFVNTNTRVRVYVGKIKLFLQVLEKGMRRVNRMRNLKNKSGHTTIKDIMNEAILMK